MTAAVLADIHGNYVALNACLKEAYSRHITTFIFLGDYIGELPYPERTMEILYELQSNYQCYFIRGNKENYWLDCQNTVNPSWNAGNSTTGTFLYEYRHLKQKDLDFFQSLNPSEEIILDGLPPITACHGSPYRINEKMLPNSENTYKIMDSVQTPLILCAHSHVQSRIEYEGKCTINPGSVGMPLYHGDRAQFLILRGENLRKNSVQERSLCENNPYKDNPYENNLYENNPYKNNSYKNNPYKNNPYKNNPYKNEEIWSEEFISLNYDTDKVIREIYEEGLDKYAPYWSMITEYSLRGNIISHGRVLSRAMEICREETGDCIWPYIPEEYWKKAVEEFIK